MTAAQLINTVFECVGVCLGLHNVGVALKTRPQGISLLMVGWSCLWAVEAAWYYHSHGEAIAAGCAGLRFWLMCIWLTVATAPKGNNV